MKLAVLKDTSGSNPLGGFHYMLFIMPMEHDLQAEAFRLMGYTVFEVTQETGERLLQQARNALAHQVEIAHLTEKAAAHG